MKMTLLEMVQEVLYSIGSDEVNSIADTVESEDVARLIRSTFYDLVTNSVIPETNGLAQLEGLADTNRPNYLKVPEDVDKVSFIRYNVSTDGGEQFKDLTYLLPDQFLSYMPDSNDDNVTVVTDGSGVMLTTRTDQMPSFWTSFDDEHVVTDAVDQSIESTLTGSRTQCMVKNSPTFLLEDDFTPAIDGNLFPLLVNESKSMAHSIIKQSVNAKVEQRARNNKVKYQNDRFKFTAVTKDRWPNFGRN